MSSGDAVIRKLRQWKKWKINTALTVTTAVIGAVTMAVSIVATFIPSWENKRRRPEVTLFSAEPKSASLAVATGRVDTHGESGVVWWAEYGPVSNKSQYKTNVYAVTGQR